MIARPHHRSTRALTLLSLTPLLVGGLALSGPASNATAKTQNAAATAGGWKTAAAHRTRLQGQGQKVSIRVTRGTGLTVARTETVRVSGRPVHHWRVRVKGVKKVRSAGRAVPARFQVMDRGTVKKSTSVRLSPGRWTTLELRTRAVPGQSLRARITVPRATRGTQVLVRGYRVSAHRPGSQDKPSDLGSTATTTRGLPAQGAYLGQAIGGNESPTSIENQVGRLGIRRTYWRATQVDSAVSTAAADLKAGRLPWISFKMPGSWASVADGQYDAWLREIHSRLDALDGPVWIAFHHEPEGDEPDIRQWRRMQEHIGPIVRGDSDNIAFTVIMTGWNQFYGDASYRLSNIWPQGIKVDVAGFDVYQSLGSYNKQNVLNTKGEDTDTTYFAKIQAWAKKEGVAWGLAETGYTDYAAERDPQWLSRTFRQLEARGGIAFTYFNSTLNSYGSSWALNATKTAQYAATAPEAVTLPR